MFICYSGAYAKDIYLKGTVFFLWGRILIRMTLEEGALRF